MLAWSAEEDNLLKALIEEHGTKKWSLIASVIKTKSSKQCRRRWKNNLDMEAKATTWTPAEDAQLIKYHRELGNKWTQISKRFGDRTDNAVKNRWHALCRKQPELAEEESPVTTVGVRRGTRTRALIEQSSSDFSDIKPARKRVRRGGTSSGGTTTEGTNGTAGTSRGGTARQQAAAAQQRPSRLGPWSNGSAGASGRTGGGGGGNKETSSLDASALPTPFDRQISSAPVNIIVPKSALTQQELLLAQQLNAKGTPFQIEVTELPRNGTSGGSFPGNFFGSSGPLLDWPESLRLGGSSGSGNNLLPEVQGGLSNSLSINELLNWLNSTTAAALPSSGELGRPGSGGSGKSGEQALESPQPTEGKGVTTRRSNRELTDSDTMPSSLHHSLSSSSGLSSGQRELLARLFSQAKDSAELAQQTLANPPLQSGDEPRLFDPQGPAELQTMLSLGIARSLSLGLGNSFLGSRSDPVGRTRSSADRQRSTWAEAAAAAIAAVDGAAGPDNNNNNPGTGAGGNAAAAAGGNTSHNDVLVNNPMLARLRSNNSSGQGGGSGDLYNDVALVAPSLTAQEIDMIVGALSMPRTRSSR